MLLSSIHDPVSGQKDTIFYVGDPMCSWCYGFTPELDMVKTNFPDVPLKIIVGGLRANGTETFSELKSFLTGHWKEVHDRTLQPFSYKILENKELIYNTEPACRSVVVVRILSPESEYKYFKLLQQAFYNKNQDPTSLQTFKELAKSLGIDEAKFEIKFHSAEIIHETSKDFKLAISMGVRGFPSVIVMKNGKLHRVSNGYITGQEMIKKLIEIGF